MTEEDWDRFYFNCTGRHLGDPIPPEELVGVLSDLIDQRRPGVNLYFSCLSAYVKPASPLFQRIAKYYGFEGVIFAACIEGNNQLHVHSNGDIIVLSCSRPDTFRRTP